MTPEQYKAKQRKDPRNTPKGVYEHRMMLRDKKQAVRELTAAEREAEKARREKVAAKNRELLGKALYHAPVKKD